MKSLPCFALLAIAFVGFFVPRLQADNLPVFTVDTADRTITTGATTIFTVGAIGTPAPTYQWQLLPFGSGTWVNLANTGAYSGVTSRYLTVANVPVGLNGTKYRAVATNSAGSATSTPALLNVSAIVKFGLGRDHSVRLLDTGEILEAGGNNNWQLGTGGALDTTTPIPAVIPGQVVTDLAVGGQGTLFLTSTGQVWSGGRPNNWQRGVQPDFSIFTLLTTGAIGMATAQTHNVVLKADGTVWTIGNNFYGQLGNGLTNGANQDTLGQIAAGATAVAAGNAQTVFLKTDGTVWGMGRVDGSSNPAYTPVQMADGVVKIAAGDNHSAFIKTDGTLWTMGLNTNGQLGDGTNTPRATSVLISSNVVAVACGPLNTYFIKTDGTLWGMGWNMYGQLGEGAPGNRLSPVQLASGVQAVQGGSYAVQYLKTDGSFWVMGRNQFGLFGNGTVNASITSVPVRLKVGRDDFVPAITSEPTNLTVAVGSPVSLTVVATGAPAPTYHWQIWPVGTSTWVDLGEGFATMTSVRAMPAQNGDLYRVVITNPIGSITSHPVLLTVTGPTSGAIVKFGLGRDHSARLLDTGEVLEAGSNNNWQLGTGGVVDAITLIPVVIPGQVITDLALGGQGTLFLTSTGQVWSGGRPNNWQRGVQPNFSIFTLLTTGAIGMAAAQDHNAVIKADGTLWTIGNNFYGQLGNGLTDGANQDTLRQIATGVTAVAAGNAQTVFLKTDGKVWGTGRVDGSTTSVYAPVEMAAGVVKLAAGDNHSAFIKTDGTLWTMGLNTNGQLGDGTNTPRATPVPISTNVVAVACGPLNTYFIKTDGTLWGMGWNLYGQLGEGGTGNRLSPVQLASGVQAVQGGSYAVQYLKTDGSFWVMGRNQFGMFGNGSTNTSATSVPVRLTGALIPNVTDLNGDGKSDLVWRNTSSNDHAVWVMNGTVASGTDSYGLSAEWRVVKVADFDGGGKNDLVWRNNTTGAVVLWQMSGTTILSSTWLYDSGTDWTAEIFADFNGDGKTDILWHNTVNGQYAIWLMNGGTVSSASGFSIAAGWSVAKAADFNGDGKTDLLWRNASTGGVVMWLQNGTTTTSTAWIYDSGTDWAFQLFADFNDDGKTDILWHNTVTGQYAFWLMDGSTVASASGFSIAAGWSVTNAADFNGDGKSDLIWRNSTSGGMVMWLQNGTVTTSTAWIYDSGTDWEIQATKDFNGDSKADILWHNTVTGEYAFWLMNGATTTSAAGFSLPAGWVLNE